MMNIDFGKVDNVVVDGVDTRDYPDFCDAFIESCDIDGVPATEKELEAINENGSFVYESVCEYLY